MGRNTVGSKRFRTQPWSQKTQVSFLPLSCWKSRFRARSGFKQWRKLSRCVVLNDQFTYRTTTAGDRIQSQARLSDWTGSYRKPNRFALAGLGSLRWLQISLRQHNTNKPAAEVASIPSTQTNDKWEANPTNQSLLWLLMEHWLFEAW